MLNKVQLIGRVGKEIELKYTVSGKAVINMSLATSYSQDGEKKTEWHNITAFGKLAENIQKYVKKGHQLYIEGALRTDKWDANGKTHYKTYVVAQRS